MYGPGIESLSDVPPVCEHCYAPIDLVNDPTGYKVCRWPDTIGLPVFFHTTCYKTAAKNRRTKRGATLANIQFGPNPARMTVKIAQDVDFVQYLRIPPPTRASYRSLAR